MHGACRASIHRKLRTTHPTPLVQGCMYLHPKPNAQVLFISNWKGFGARARHPDCQRLVLGTGRGPWVGGTLVVTVWCSIAGLEKTLQLLLADNRQTIQLYFLTNSNLSFTFSFSLITEIRMNSQTRLLVLKKGSKDDRSVHRLKIGKDDNYIFLTCRQFFIGPLL